MKYFFVAFVGILFFPVGVHAAVIINEIAWMGTVVAASDEWIELYNDGTEDVSLDGWKLVADGGAPTISLNGSIVAGGFYLLERTDETTVPDQTADKIYTGDLANAGETLTLFDGAGVVIDTIVGGADWKDVGGNNTTKDTAQRQQDGSWITGVPTPKAVNTTTPATSPSSSGSPSASSGGSSTTKKVTGGYKQIVFAYAGPDMMAIAGADVLFEGYAVSEVNDPLSSAKYEWSFGDGGRGGEKERRHAYQEPGTYIVVLEVQAKKQKHKDSLIVEVIPADVHIKHVEHGPSGYVEIENKSQHEIDLSGWHLAIDHVRGRRPTGIFTIPRNTRMLPYASVKFPASITKLTPGSSDVVVLQFPDGRSTSLSGGTQPEDGDGGMVIQNDSGLGE